MISENHGEVVIGSSNFKPIVEEEGVLASKCWV